MRFARKVGETLKPGELKKSRFSIWPILRFQGNKSFFNYMEPQKIVKPNGETSPGGGINTLSAGVLENPHLHSYQPSIHINVTTSRGANRTSGKRVKTAKKGLK